MAPRIVFSTASRAGTTAFAGLRRSAGAARRAYSAPAPKKQGMSVWPFLGVVAAGTGVYVMLVNNRKELNEKHKAKMAAERAAAETAKASLPTPANRAFDPAEVTVFFVLGGPGAGKGTQCARLVSEYNFTHLSAGDLLRAEQARPGSQFGDLIREYLKNGAIVPMEVTIKLLENAMAEARKTTGSTRFLIDGFPRKMDQAIKFEESVCPAKLVLFFECPEKELERRLLERGKTSGRTDDNIESIRKRFRTFVDTSMPVVDHFAKEGRVLRIDSSPPVDEVFATTIDALTKKLGKF
ncbi:hypothetical protein TD95_000890 [Thielaviopsis punctulata]|uniref:Uridylate kinase n=1 Tax=Thielaviopsis punctulata TaxID=72032 RepID=A0A0F4ZA55_9PEZI|nr:hypothetical protein TD95_000890 [Thielaviopsis punctulata]